MLQRPVQRGSSFYCKYISEVLNDCAMEDFLFLGGDFNCTEDVILDRNHAEPHPASQHALKQLVRSHGLVDVWRRMHPDCRQYTWSHIRESRVSSARLDRVYCFKHHFNIFSLRQWWDHGKTQIRLLCQQHTLNVTRDATRSMKDLETNIVELEH